MPGMRAALASTARFASQRAGFASLAILMVLGGALLLRVREERPAALS